MPIINNYIGTGYIIIIVVGVGKYTLTYEGEFKEYGSTTTTKTAIKRVKDTDYFENLKVK